MGHVPHTTRRTASVFRLRLPLQGPLIIHLNCTMAPEGSTKHRQKFFDGIATSTPEGDVPLVGIDPATSVT